MKVEQALEELKKYAQDFMLVGDATEAIHNNKDEFIHKWAKVMQYYRYIINKVKPMSDEWFMALDIISDVSRNNPSLEEWIVDIIAPSQKKKQEQVKTQGSVSIDTSGISNQIESYVSEIRNMQSWDPDYIKDIAWKLQEYQKILISNHSSFEPQLYQSLMEDINASLAQIERFNNMLNSEAMDSIKRM